VRIIFHTGQVRKTNWPFGTTIDHVTPFSEKGAPAASKCTSEMTKLGPVYIKAG
jgi:hypothetical protein